MNRDNLQESGLVARIGWLAGIIDGEGTVSLLISERKGNDARCNMRIQPRVTIGNTDEGIINRIIETLDMMGVGRYVKHERPKARNIPGFNANKPVTTVSVDGFERLRLLLPVIIPHIAGEKRQRAEILNRYIVQRSERAEREGKAANMSYTQEDVDILIEFLRLTRSKNIDRLTALLNEHTREARQANRRANRRIYYRAAADRGYVRPSRRALVSRESVRATGN